MLGNIHYSHNVAIIGSGLSALILALELNKAGIEDICIIERESVAGGNLVYACGTKFELEDKRTIEIEKYVSGLIEKVNDAGIKIYTEMTVFRISKKKTISAFSTSLHMVKIKADAVILATGSREISRGELFIPGFRPYRVFTAGVVQRMIAKKNIELGKSSAILGTNNIAFIIADIIEKRGDEVKCFIESSDKIQASLNNEYVDKFKDRIYFNSNCTLIKGKETLEGITIERKTQQDSPAEVIDIDCDNFIISKGFLPETELATVCEIETNENGVIIDERFHTSRDGIFAVGDCTGVHTNLVEIVGESKKACEQIVDYVKSRNEKVVNRLAYAVKTTYLKKPLKFK